MLLVYISSKESSLSQGMTVPAMHAFLGKWAPPLERSRMVTITYSGQFFGNVIAFPLSGVLCQCGFAGGWPSVFYLFGEQRYTHTIYTYTLHT